MTTGLPQPGHNLTTWVERYKDYPYTFVMRQGDAGTGVEMYCIAVVSRIGVLLTLTGMSTSAKAAIIEARQAIDNYSDTFLWLGGVAE